MRTRLIRTDKGLALVLDRALLKQMGFDAKTVLEAWAAGDVLVVSRVRPKSRQRKLKQAMARSHKDYAGVFRKLAD